MSSSDYPLVLAVQPYTRGFAFTLFEAPHSPVDWGLKVIRDGDRNALSIAALEKLIKVWRPDILLLMERAKERSSPSDRVLELRALIEKMAINLGLPVQRYSRDEIRKTFTCSGSLSRYHMAQELSKDIPALSEQLPPPRKVWDPEDPRMHIFDAAGLTRAYFAALAKSQPKFPL